MSATHRPSTELWEHKAVCTAHRVELILRSSSGFWLAWVQLLQVGLDQIWVGQMKCPSGDMRRAAEPLCCLRDAG